MGRPIQLLATVGAALALTGALAACGERVNVAGSSPQVHSGAELFSQRCSGCHTLAAAATHGSASDIRTAERNDGPNFNVRKETVQRVLFAIHNGGFSGAIMPQNVVVGPDARAVAAFVAKYSGRKASTAPNPQLSPSPGGGGASGGAGSGGSSGGAGGGGSSSTPGG